MPRNNGNSNSNNNNGNESGNKPRKFRRMLGVLGGGSKKKKSRNQESAPNGGAAASPGHAAAAVARDQQLQDADSVYDEESTIYGVNVEERSVMTSGSARAMLGELDGGRRRKVAPSPAGDTGSAAASHKHQQQRQDSSSSYMLKVVLLLMDPQTRRFELLQLEFDSSKALVSDVLSQIPISATEEALKEQSYIGICGHDGKQMPQQFLLSQICKGDEVLVAIPYGQEGTQVAKLARPILNDVKVVSMLISSGINVDGWKEKKRVKTASNSKNRGLDASQNIRRAAGDLAPQRAMSTTTTTKAEESTLRVKSVTPTTESAAPRRKWGLMAITGIVIAICLQIFHLFISAPIRPNHVVSPGIWLSKCGLLAFMPSCRNEYLTMDEEGNLSLYDSERELAWQIQGNVCRPGDFGCIPGMQVKEDGSVLVGSRHVTHVTMYKESQLTPWPFAVMPQVKPIVSASNKKT